MCDEGRNIRGKGEKLEFLGPNTRITCCRYMLERCDMLTKIILSFIRVVKKKKEILIWHNHCLIRVIQCGNAKVLN